MIKKKVKMEIKGQIKNVELKSMNILKKRKFSEAENFGVKLSYLEKINKNLG